MIGCQRQLRYAGRPVPTGMGAITVPMPAGLDFGSIFAVGIGRGVDTELLGEVLPAFEEAILRGLNDQGEEEG